MKEKFQLSVIVPVFNEQATVAKVLSKLLTIAEVKQIVVVDDGSTDNSPAIIQKFWRQLPVKSQKKMVLIRQKNGGKGSAIQAALPKVTGEYVLIQDADLEYDPTDIPCLWAALSHPNVEVVFGSRFLGPHSNLLFWHRTGNYLLNLLVNLLFDTTLSDMETCYKLVPTLMLKQMKLQARSFDFEPEVTCKLLKTKVRIFEVPISYVGRDFSEGKKITWRDGFAALATIIKLRLS